MQKRLVTLTLTLGLTAALTAQTTLHQFGSVDFGTRGGTTSDYTFSLVEWASDTTLLNQANSVGADFQLSGIVGGNAFTYDIQLTNAGTEAARLGSGLGDADIQPGVTFTVEIINISNPNVIFDGYTALQTANHADGSNTGITVGGVTYTDADVPFNSKDGVAFTATSDNTFDVFGDDDLRLASLQFQFSAVPEPGAYALLVGVLALGYTMLRRRADK